MERLPNQPQPEKGGINKPELKPPISRGRRGFSPDQPDLDTDPNLETLQRAFANLFQDLSDEEVRRFVEALPELTEEQEKHLRLLEERPSKELGGSSEP